MGHQHNQDERIQVIRQSDPDACGGTDETRDLSAPTVILSEEMINFSAYSKVSDAIGSDENGDPIRFISAYAAPAAGGTLMCLETGSGFDRREEPKRALALVLDDPFPTLCALTKRIGLSRDNGHYTHTNGLPENFGGEIRIRYATGETISISSNQSPVLSAEQGSEILACFQELLQGEKAVLPSLESLETIRFDSTCSDGGFTRALVTLLPDGTAERERKRRFSNEHVYEESAHLSAETVGKIKSIIQNYFLLAWQGLPDAAYIGDEEKTFTFRFAGGSEICVKDGRAAPPSLNNGLFQLELELVIKS